VSNLSLIHAITIDLGPDVAEQDYFRGFASFLDGVGLPADWSPFVQTPDRDSDLGGTDVNDSAEVTTPTPANRASPRPGTPFSSWLPSAPGTARSSERQDNLHRRYHPSRSTDYSRLD
jgi:hypothetical protein